MTPGRPQEEIGDGRTQKITGFPFSPLLLPEAGLFRANHAVCKSGGMGGVSVTSGCVIVVLLCCFLFCWEVLLGRRLARDRALKGGV